MKTLLALSLLVAVSCSTQNNKYTKADAGNDSVSKAKDVKFSTPTKNVTLNNQPKPDSPVAKNTSTATKKEDPEPSKPVTKNPDTKPSTVALSGCLQKLIKAFSSEEVQNPPRKIYSYKYKGQTVFYVTPPCCDFFSDLYDSNCNIIAHPDGGITGKGDRRAPDFIETRTNEKLVWEDKRKYR